MATTAEVQFICDAILQAGFTAVTWPAFVRRSKLVTELQALESEARNMSAAENAQNAAYTAEWVAMQGQIAEKQAEIDQLG